MRQIRTRVPSDSREAVTTALTDADIEYLVSEEASGRDAVIVEIPVPGGGVDPILELLYDAGLDENAYTVISEVETAGATTQAVADLEDRYVAGPKGESGVSYPEIKERAENLEPGRATYIAFAALAAIVAVAGLLLDSAIIIVGAMVIAPFAGSSLSAAVGAVIDDRGMVVDSVGTQLVGLVVAYVGAVAMSLVLRETFFVPAALAITRVQQVGAFLTPSLLAVVVALAAGAAGALALATDLPVSIAGVAVAAAIVPSAATAGIGTVWNEPLVVAGALVLLFMNVVFINVSAYVALVALGYRDSVTRSVRENLTISVRTGAYALVVLGFVVSVIVVSAATASYVGFEGAANREVQTTIDEPVYDDLELVGVSSSYSARELFGGDVSVTVTLSRTTGSEYPTLAQTLQERISAATDRPVTVQLRFLDYEPAVEPTG
ncbi:DUF389 domain-containing protein [Halococcus saccharolyticus]|uniref:TIGR00341 family protein n=1 Tax=Halococcus saccharolyticus DSM 5350 TaxID=1227455 RepID=M0M9G2_9EURY|nr:DUF389 domain-containing protein [Halococcus saccharolyticus]EMA42432.1 hypothetical protein C449_16947 [Halococcus saccharolyticus DSM 5350]